MPAAKAFVRSRQTRAILERGAESAAAWFRAASTSSGGRHTYIRLQEEFAYLPSSSMPSAARGRLGFEKRPWRRVWRSPRSRWRWKRDGQRPAA